MNSKKLPVLLLLFFVPLNTLTRERFCELKITDRAGKKISITVEIADNEYERQLGLMYRRDLPYNRGMIFIFEREEILNFWMKNTYIPLDIAYISGRGKIIDIQTMKPLDISVTYPSKLPSRYALEANAGWFRKNNITEGSVIFFNGCLSK